MFLLSDWDLNRLLISMSVLLLWSSYHDFLSSSILLSDRKAAFRINMCSQCCVDLLNMSLLVSFQRLHPTNAAG